MPKKINYTLTQTELLNIEQAIKNHPDLRLRDRARIIRLLHLEHKPQEVAELLSISPGQVYYWHKRWRTEGLDGLADRPRSGRPVVADEDLQAELEKLLATNPQELGYAFTVWGVSRLLAYLKKELGTSMHENTLRNLLDKMGYVYRRPKHDLANLQDEDAKAKAQEMLDDLKKKPAPVKSTYSLWTKQP